MTLLESAQVGCAGTCLLGAIAVIMVYEWGFWAELGLLLVSPIAGLLIGLALALLVVLIAHAAGSLGR